VKDLSLIARAGEITAIVGESGSGKTITALSCLRLLPERNSRLSSGVIRLDEQDVLSMPKAELSKFRGKQVAMIFQEPMTSLNPVLRVGDQVAEVILNHQGVGRAEARQLVVSLLKEVGIPEPELRYRDYPHQLSGGLRQRIVIAMAIACQPKLIIADEPTTALDVTMQAQVMELLEKLSKDLGIAILLISHDIGLVASYAQYVYVMYAGRVVESGALPELLNSPQHPYTRGLKASVHQIGDQADRLYAIKGMVPNIGGIEQGCPFVERCDRQLPICPQMWPKMRRKPSGEIFCHNDDI
jgi:oligopeptide/dipeptide ABC transporter ATP-binding protein